MMILSRFVPSKFLANENANANLFVAFLHWLVPPCSRLIGNKTSKHVSRAAGEHTLEPPQSISSAGHVSQWLGTSSCGQAAVSTSLGLANASHFQGCRSFKMLAEAW